LSILTQIAKYINGVGKSQGCWTKVAGGAFGVDVAARIATRHQEWAGSPIWSAAGIFLRIFPSRMVVNDSVRQRMNGQPEDLFGGQGLQRPYFPVNLLDREE
jgi:hypothetical protein